jgi:hypothetical protein
VNAVTDQLMYSHKEMKRLQDCTSSTSLKKPKDLDKRTSSFNIAIRKGYDIHSEHKSRVVSIEKEMGRKMAESDFEFYKDKLPWGSPNPLRYPQDPKIVSAYVNSMYSFASI